jgi:outer membrane protein assembly factor BamB
VVGSDGVVVGADGVVRSLDRTTGAERWRTTIDAGEPTSYPIFMGDTFLRGGEVVSTAHRFRQLVIGPDLEAGGARVRIDAVTGATIAAEEPAVVGQVVRGSRWAGANKSSTSAGDEPVRLEVGDFDDPTYHWGGRVGGPWPITNHESLTLGVDRLYHRYQAAQGEGPDVLAAYDLTKPCPVDGTTGEPTCTPLWTRLLSVNVISDIVISEDSGTLFAASGDQGRLRAYDAATGVERWRGDEYEAKTKPAVANGLVYTVTSDSLRVYDADGCGAATCTPLWSAPLPAVPLTEPVVAGNVLYVGTTGGSLGAIYAFPAAGCGGSTCAPRWSAPLEARPSAIAVALGRVYVVTSAGLTAFGPSA